MVDLLVHIRFHMFAAVLDYAEAWVLDVQPLVEVWIRFEGDEFAVFRHACQEGSGDHAVTRTIFYDGLGSCQIKRCQESLYGGV